MISSLDSLTSWLSHSLATCSVVGPSYLVTESDSSCHFHCSFNDTWQRDFVYLFIHDKTTSLVQVIQRNEQREHVSNTYILFFIDSFLVSFFLRSHSSSSTLFVSLWMTMDWERDEDKSKKRRQSSKEEREREDKILFPVLSSLRIDILSSWKSLWRDYSLWLTGCWREREGLKVTFRAMCSVTRKRVRPSSHAFCLLTLRTTIDMQSQSNWITKRGQSVE